MAYQGRYGNDPPKKSGGSGAWKIVLAVVLTIIIMLGLMVGVVLWYVNSKLGKVTQAEFVEKDTSGQDLSALIGNLDETDPSIVTISTEATEPPTEEPTDADYGQSGRVVNILVIGQDSREGEDHKLSDGIMLLTLNKQTRTLTMTSFLRDSYVKLADYRGHECGWNRINTSYALGYSWYGDAGAMEMLNLTIANNYGVNVDGDVELSFDTFAKVVDYVGGVDIELVGDEYTRMNEVAESWNSAWRAKGLDAEEHVTEGMNHLDGFMALEYARERHVNNADSDMNRVKRQQKILAQVVEKCARMSATELDKLIDMVLGEIVTNISTEDMKMYITELTPYLFNLNMVSNQCPAEGTYWGEMVELPDGTGGVLKCDFEANKRLLAPIVNGES